MKHSTFKYSLASATLLGLGLGALSASPVHADDSTSLTQQVQDLDQKVNVLQRKLENEQEETQKVRQESAAIKPTTTGLSLQSADGNYTFRTGGVLQADGRAFEEGYRGQYAGSVPGTVNASDDFLVRRARLTVDGSAYGQYGFRITEDFAPATPTLVDAYVSDSINPGVRIYAGKQIPGLEIERLQTSTDTRFNELSLVSDLIPTRDVGIQVSGDLFHNILSYTAGVLNGAADGVTSNNTNLVGNKEEVARLVVQPFANTPGYFQGLSVGVAASHQNNEGGTAAPSVNTAPTLQTDLSTYSSIGQQTIFNYRKDTNQANTAFANGEQTRLIPQLAYFNGSFGLVTEYVREREAVERVYGAAPTNLFTDNLQLTAAQATFVWAITGEDESLKIFQPTHDFNSSPGNWGGWELALRASRVDFDRNAFEYNGQLVNNTNSLADPTSSVRSANDTGIGVNWYPNKLIRVSTDYDHTSFQWGGGGTATNPLNRPSENVLIARVQAAF